MAEEIDYSSVPLSERLSHKVWKVRLESYEELKSEFEKSRDDKSSCFDLLNTNPELLKKFVTDSNVVAQESGIQALQSYLQFGGNLSNVGRLRNTGIISALCEKGLSSSRAGTKLKSIECILEVVELTNSADSVIEEIIPHLKNRLPKLVVGCISALVSIVENFGCGVVLTPKILLPAIPPLFAHSDKNVRAEATKLTLSLYKWMGEALELVIFPELKPIQQKDLLKSFENVDKSLPKQLRLTRKQKEEAELQKKKEQEISMNIDIEMKDGEESSLQDSTSAPFDAFDLLEDVSILSKLPNDLNTRLNSAKWKDRKEVLEEVHSILEKIKKIAVNDDYSDLVRSFARCMKDANVQVVQLAANCTEFIVNGLRKNFNKYEQIIIRPALERTKEKKASVADALNNLLDAIFKYSSLTDILNDILWGMKSKIPQVKIASTFYLKRCLEATTECPNGDEIEQIMKSGVFLLTEPQEPIRQASTEMIGTIMKITGERYLASYLEKVDENRKSKIMTSFENATCNVQMKNSTPLQHPGTSSKSSKEHIRTTVGKRAEPSVSQKSMRFSLTPSYNLQPSTKTNINSSIPTKRGATSPAKRSDDSSKVPTYGRGLTSRLLISEEKNQNQPTSSNIKQQTYSNDAEKEELRLLREEKKAWEVSRKKYSQLEALAEEERIKFNKEKTSLLDKIEQLQKEQSNSTLMIKQKETQLLRSSGDLENAKLKIRDLEQTIEMMKLQQNSYSNQSHPPVNRMNYDNIFNSSTSPYKSDTFTRRESPLKQAIVNSGELSSRVTRLSIDGKSGTDTSTASSKLNTLSHFTSPQKLAETSHPYSPSFSRPSLDYKEEEEDSWKRAAEVTSQLKARIEKMKARSRSTMSNFS